MNKINQQIANQIIENIKKNNSLPWQKPWKQIEGRSDMNIVSKKPYRGVNIILTSMQGFTSPYWMTFKQCQDLGGKILKGSKSTTIIYYTRIEVEDRKNPNEKKIIPLLKKLSVFNLEQTEGIKTPKSNEFVLNDIERIECCENIVSEYYNAPAITESVQNQAFYIPSKDTVSIPAIGQYKTSDEYYAVLFHELGHSTGHKSRLDRNLVGLSSDKHSYSFEELIAEFTACFLCKHSQIDTTINNSTAYIKSWVKTFEENPEMLIKAASAAQKAFDYIVPEMAEEIQQAA